MADPSFSVDLTATGVSVELCDVRDGDEPPPEPVEPLTEAIAQSLRNAVSSTLVGEGVVAGSVDLIFVPVEQMIALNAEHMGGTGPTDVLSFPLDDPSEGDSFGFTPHIGDIVICCDVAQAQAPAHAGSIEAELHLLAVHAALHLIGHDHAEEEERSAMQALEAKYLAPFGISHPGNQT